MSEVSFVEGKPQKYVAKISFNLNLENKKSSKITRGENIFYDGHVASYTSPSGINITGESRSLKSAIQADWLALENGKNDIVPAVSSKPLETKKKDDFDPKLGGNFDTFVKKESKVTREEDLIVKQTKPIKKGLEKSASKGGKLEVAGDQVDVKKVSEPLTVGSSTTVPRTKTHSKVIETSDSYGADSSTPRTKKASEPPAVRKKKTFTVDASTPVIQDGASLEEVNRAKGSEPLDNQEAVVVKKIKPGTMQVQSMEGVTLKKTQSPKDMTVNTKVSAGGDGVVDIQSSADTVIVKTASEVKKDYPSMLPSDWKSMHWVKKEKWIKSQMDVKLLEYILSVEETKALTEACKERLKELAQ